MIYANQTLRCFWNCINCMRNLAASKPAREHQKGQSPGLYAHFIFWCVCSGGNFSMHDLLAPKQQ